MPRGKKSNKQEPTEIGAIKHPDAKRANIPTEETSRFIDTEHEELKHARYARDMSKDPQLVWRGKFEQDQNPMEVPLHRLHIQEHIHPRVLIDDFRARHTTAEQDQEVDQLGLFDDEVYHDFDGLDFEDRLDFYQHEHNWQNRMILGDSLQVMASLAEMEGLAGKVQMIYIDPPYGISFRSNWQAKIGNRDVKDTKAEDVNREPEVIQAYQDTWADGINSYLAYLRDRLIASRELISDTGSIFVQIGNENVHLVRCLLDEVFGEDNISAQIAFKSTSPLGQSGLPIAYDYILWYAKNKVSMKFRDIFQNKDISEDKEYRFIETAPSPKCITKLGNEDFLALSDRNPVFRRQKLTSSGFTKTCTFEFELFGNQCRPYGRKSWATNTVGMQRLIKANRLFLLSGNPYYKRFYGDAPITQYTNCWSDQPAAREQVYVVQTAPKFIQRCMLMTTDPGDLVLDPTCGSGTTAYVAEQWGRRWITVDTSRVALALARTRLMTAMLPYYILADSEQGIEQESKITGKPPVDPDPDTDKNIRYGFVYKRAPHAMLQHVANNEEIDEIHEKWQVKLESLLESINTELSKQWQDWEVTFDPPQDASVKAKDLITEWWKLRRMRQEEIDASIARHADHELLYDQPYEDKKRIRVAGPFTVESLAMHRKLDVTMPLPESEEQVQQQNGSADFVQNVIDHLRKAGIQNTKKAERLEFDSVERFAGKNIHAEGCFTDAHGSNKRVAICIGPEHSSVTRELVQKAAIESVTGLPFDMLYILGFAIEPGAYPERDAIGKLVVQVAKMNLDLSIGGELLKNTGSGNLFMVFGEPDIEIRELPNDELEVEIRGVDIYDPMIGEVRSSKKKKAEGDAGAEPAEIKARDLKEDMACWFIDTDYDGRAFFVRHAYFTGADKPYDKLKRALKAEVDEDAWRELYRTVSRPFRRPQSGKIAVKVINHYGDEVMKVYEV